MKKKLDEMVPLKTLGMEICQDELESSVKIHVREIANRDRYMAGKARKI